METVRKKVAALVDAGTSPGHAVKQVVQQIPAEQLGSLLLACDKHLRPFEVKSIFGWDDYAQSWEDFLRGTLESILFYDYA